MKKLAVALSSLMMTVGVIGVFATPGDAATGGRASKVLASHFASSSRAAAVIAQAADPEFVTILDGGFTDAYPCEPENYNWDYPSIPIDATVNGCPVRVWMHEYPNGLYQHKGWGYCVSPIDEVVSVPEQYRKPENIQITSNRSNC